jgi:nicotinate-nucleotide adenylyltransferase
VSRLVFLPNARHNFKKGNVVLDFQHRLALVRDALEPGMEAWEDDADGSGYTAELLQKLYRKHPQVLFHFVIGSDNLANLPLWYDFAWLRANARFLIIPRPGYPLPQNVLRRIKRKTLKIEPCPISSSQIRSRIAAEKSISGLVPESLEQRIIELYRPLLAK